MNLFLSYLMSDPWYYFSWIVIVAFSICVHEYAHAYIALKRGDDTAAEEGHLTLNPLIQMGPMSLILLFVIGIAWGAVPVNPGRFRKRSDAALVAFAGPAANVLLCLLFAGLYGFKWGSPLIADFFRYAAVANGVLFTLNMLPVPMLDGWSVFGLFIPQMERLSPEQAQHYSLFAFILLFLTPLWTFIWQIGTGIAMFFAGVWVVVWGVIL